MDYKKMPRNVSSVWCRKGADRGSGGDKKRLGDFYKNGYGVEKNLEMDRHWYREAVVDFDDKDAGYKLGLVMVMRLGDQPKLLAM